MTSAEDRGRTGPRPRAVRFLNVLGGLVLGLFGCYGLGVLLALVMVAVQRGVSPDTPVVGSRAGTLPLIVGGLLVVCAAAGLICSPRTRRLGGGLVLGIATAAIIIAGAWTGLFLLP